MERSRGEVVREVFKMASRDDVNNIKTPAEVADLIQKVTLPYFGGNFEDMVSALAQSDNGPSYQTPVSVWSLIQHIDNRAPFLGSALSVVAIKEGVTPPPCPTQGAAPSVTLG